MNSKVVEKLKTKAKEDLVLINQRRTRIRYDIEKISCISHRSMGLKIAEPLSLSCTQSNADMEQLYLTLSIFIQQHSNVYEKVNVNGYCPENHMKHIWETQKLMCSSIYDELK